MAGTGIDATDREVGGNRAGIGKVGFRVMTGR